MNPSELPFLKESDYMLLNVGVDQYVPFVVRRQQFTELVYDPVAQGALAFPQAGAGLTPSGTQVAAYLAQIQFGLSGTLTAINGVVDIFALLDNLEMYQVFFGVAPRTERVWVQQPVGAFVTGLDQNIVPSATYTDVTQFDGFQSPFGGPSPISEFFTLKSLSVTFALSNPAPWQVSPRFDFYINRLYVEPIDDIAIVARLLKRNIPARYVSMGNPKVNMPWPSSSYDSVIPLPSAAADMTQSALTALLQKSGYLAAPRSS